MTDLKDDVLAALGKISGPDGSALPASGKLSEFSAIRKAEDAVIQALSKSGL